MVFKTILMISINIHFYFKRLAIFLQLPLTISNVHLTVILTEPLKFFAIYSNSYFNLCVRKIDKTDQFQTVPKHKPECSFFLILTKCSKVFLNLQGIVNIVVFTWSELAINCVRNLSNYINHQHHHSYFNSETVARFISTDNCFQLFFGGEGKNRTEQNLALSGRER